jgi:hypothetical protein
MGAQRHARGARRQAGMASTAEQPPMWHVQILPERVRGRVLTPLHVDAAGGGVQRDSVRRDDTADAGRLRVASGHRDAEQPGRVAGSYGSTPSQSVGCKTYADAVYPATSSLVMPLRNVANTLVAYAWDWIPLVPLTSASTLASTAWMRRWVLVLPPAANARLSPTLQQRGAHERSELLVGDSAVGPLGLNPRFRRAVVVSTRDQMLDRFVITAGRQSHVCGLALARLSSRLNMAVLDHVTQVLLVRDQVWGEN